MSEAGPPPDNIEPAPAPADPAPQVGFMRVLRYFLRLGTIGFGGPIAVVGYMQRDLVEHRGWNDPLAVLSTREQEVLALMAEGRSNVGIAHRLWVAEGTVEKHVHHIFTKLSLLETGDDHRRVLAALT